MSVVHILRDGTILDDITGHVVKLEEAGELYQFLDSLNQVNSKPIKSRRHNKNILGEK